MTKAIMPVACLGGDLPTGQTATFEAGLLHDHVAQIDVVVRSLFDLGDRIANTPGQSLLMQRDIANVVFVDLERFRYTDPRESRCIPVPDFDRLAESD